MKLKLGVLGARDSVKIVQDIVAENSEFDVKPYIYNDRESIIPLLKAAQYEDIDMWLCTGRIPYVIAKDWGGVTQPMFYMPYKGSSLYRTLCEILYTRKINMNSISFDSILYDDLKEVYEELGISDEPAYVRPFQLGMTEADVVKYHYDLWQIGKSKVAVTCTLNVKNKLEQLGVPVFRVLPARAAVESTINIMLRAFEIETVRDAQIAVQMLELDTFTSANEFYSTDEMYNMEVKVTQKLITYAKKVQGSLKTAGPGRFVIFTTRGMLRMITDDFTKIPEMEELEQISKDLITCGIGIGVSAYEAEFHAAKALVNANKYGKGSWMVFFDDKTITGPLGEKKQITYSYGSAKLQSLSERTSISVSTLSKIDAIMKKIKRTEISAHDLSQHMQILPRSARRIISELERAGIAEDIGDENPNPRGRPRKLYRINLE